jgi:hypothetical protein
MKGFTKDHKFIPMTDYKKVTRKSRDQKTIGVRLRLDKLTGQPNKFSNLSDEQLRNLITKNNKELGVALRKKIPIDRNDPNSMLVDSDELLMVSDDRKADETARAILELKNRSEKELEKMRKEAQNDPITKAVKKLAQSSNFHSSSDHTWGWTEKKPNLPTYGEGVSFAQHGADEGEKVHRFGKEGMGNRAFATLIGEDKLKEVLADAKKEHLTTEFASLNNLIIQADVFTSSEKNRPVILKLTERSRERYYLIAPRFEDKE